MAPGGEILRYHQHFGENVLRHGSHEWLPYRKDEVRLKSSNTNLMIRLPKPMTCVCLFWKRRKTAGEASMPPLPQKETCSKTGKHRFPKGQFAPCSSQKGSDLTQPEQVRGLNWSSWLLTLTVVQGGMEWVMNTLEPMTLSRPMTVPPPRMEAPA